MIRKIIWVSLLGFVFMGIHAEAQVLSGIFLPVPGSLSGLGAGASSCLFSDHTAEAAVWNPAVPGGRNLSRFTLGGTVAFPVESGEGAGAAFKLSGLKPGPLGVIWGSMDGVFRSPELPSWSAPQGYSFAGGIAKRGARNVLFGAGISAAYIPDTDDEWTVSGSLGTLIEFPELAPYGSSLSLSFTGIGPALDTILLPTPIAAWQSKLISTGKIGVSLSALLASPDFQDLGASFGASFQLGRHVSLDLDWNASFRQLDAWIDENNDAYSFSFAPGVRISLDSASFLRFGKYGVSPTIGLRNAGASVLAAETAFVFSAGEQDVSGPLIQLGPLENTTLSPHIQEKILLPFSVEDDSAIERWSVQLTDPGGFTIHRESEDLEKKEQDGVLSNLLRIKKSLSTPDRLELPLGTDLSDGMYRITATAMDEHGNQSSSEELQFNLDATAPHAALKADYAVFSPNGDGVRDLLHIQQTGSVEKEWKGLFINEQGITVSEYSWIDSSPLNFSWDASTEEGNYLPGGRYTYVLSSEDEAGNLFQTAIEDLIIDAENTKPRIQLKSKAMSNDPASNFKNIQLLIEPARTHGLESWTISVLDLDADTVRSWQGSSAALDVLPEIHSFDGRFVQGDPVPDGDYRFKLSLNYSNGDNPVTYTDFFSIDSALPSGRVRASNQRMYLDRNQRIVFYHDLAPGPEWYGLIMDQQGTIVRKFALGMGGEPAVDWNGMDESGRPLEAGSYSYAAEGTSAVGLKARTNTVEIELDNGNYEVALLAELNLFSSASGTSKQRFYPRVNRRDRIISYILSIKNQMSGTEVRRFEGRAPIPALFSWDGRDEFGASLPDGNYSADFSIRIDGGEQIQAATVHTQLDSSPPKAALDISSSLFSPNGNGVLDTVDFIIQADEADRWTGEILNSQNQVIRRYEWPGYPPSRISWDGSDGRGGVFPDGLYYFRLQGRDAADNRVSIASETVEMDSRIPSASVGADKIAFSPDNDGFADSVGIHVNTAFSDGLESWKVYIMDSDGNSVVNLEEVHSVSRESAQTPASLYTWNGQDSNGNIAADGHYYPVVALRYHKGDELEVRGNSFLLDTTGPQLSLDLSPLPFSPDGDGNDDFLSIMIKASDVSPIDAWMLSILDPQSNPFTVFSGKTLPEAPFVWNGTDTEGNLVEAAQDYQYILRVRDQLGNITEQKGIIPTDVFVLRDGDRLKIRISSIVFPPSAATLTGIDAETDRRNALILDKIAVVLEKYPDYRIRIEGHAVNISGTDREERSELQPLSLSRANTVLEALVARGVSRSRLEARGIGGKEPLVPHGNAALRWRNRRVEFILMR